MLEGSVRRKGNVHIKAVTDMEVSLRGVQRCVDCHDCCRGGGDSDCVPIAVLGRCGFLARLSFFKGSREIVRRLAVLGETSHSQPPLACRPRRAVSSQTEALERSFYATGRHRLPFAVARDRAICSKQAVQTMTLAAWSNHTMALSIPPRPLVSCLAQFGVSIFFPAKPPNHITCIAHLPSSAT